MYKFSRILRKKRQSRGDLDSRFFHYETRITRKYVQREKNLHTQYTPYEGPSLTNLDHDDQKLGDSDMKLEGNRCIIDRYFEKKYT